MKAKRYVIISVDAPVIDGKKIIEDANMGGIKLTYEVSNDRTSLSQRDKEIHIYLKPYKNIWGSSKKDVEKGEWGNTNSPLSNVWLRIKKDYTNYDKEYMEISYEKVTNHKLISHLNKQKKKFVLGEDEEIRQIPFKEKVLFILDEIKERIKYRIFLR